jgi:hypothetical protein
MPVAVCRESWRSTGALAKISRFLQIYTPFLDAPSPSFVYFMHGLLLFLYQVGLRKIQTYRRTEFAGEWLECFFVW